MMCACHALDDRKLSRELWVLWAALMPKRPARRALVEREHFLDAAVAVGRDDQNPAWQLAVRLESNDYIMMELALLPMIDQLEIAVAFPD